LGLSSPPRTPCSRWTVPLEHKESCHVEYDEALPRHQLAQFTARPNFPG
jgi:hypothetical protein